MLKLYLVCLTYLLLVTDVARCNPDYLFNSEADGWLKLHSFPATWEDAFLRCHYEGAVLASPLNKQLADALHKHMSQFGDDQPFFLGTHDLFLKGDFISVEGVKLSEMDIDSKVIRSTNGDCLNMYSDGIVYQIESRSCNEQLPYICYRKLDNQTMNECGTFDNGYQLDERTGSCYKVHLKHQTWSSAYRICAAEGGHLVILNDGEEARIVKDMFPARDVLNDWEQFHIGLLAWGEDHTWMTVHGERIEDVFHEWRQGPYGGFQSINEADRATLTRAGYLRDGNLNTKAMFVCEKSPDFIRFESFIPDQSTMTRRHSQV